MGPCLSAPPKAEKPLTPEDVVGVLQGRGWEATIVTEDSPVPVVDVNPNGISSASMAAAPTTRPWRAPGCSAYGIANCSDIKTTQELGDICQEVKAAGRVPSVHGDEFSILGCGFCKLWVTDGFADADLDIEKPDHHRGGPRRRQGRGWRDREPLRRARREGRVHQLRR